jgi:hypothetical protein
MTLRLAKCQFEEAGARDGIVPVGGDIAEAERGVHGLGFSHAGERIKAHAGIAEFAGGGDDSVGEGEADFFLPRAEGRT